MKDFYLGNIRETHPESLRNAQFVSEPCTQCQALPICGGRCLYANVTKLWGNEGFRQVCATVTDMIDALQEALPEVRSLIDDGRVRLNSFDYMKYNGCEIIP
jgi:sulfatase maturation enzyme AslB (radical SAM superfamily)